MFNYQLPSVAHGRQCLGSLSMKNCNWPQWYTASWENRRLFETSSFRGSSGGGERETDVCSLRLVCMLFWKLLRCEASCDIHLFFVKTATLEKKPKKNSVCMRKKRNPMSNNFRKLEIGTNYILKSWDARWQFTRLETRLRHVAELVNLPWSGRIWQCSWLICTELENPYSAS